MPLMSATGTTQTGRAAASLFESVVVALAFAIGMFATMYPHRLVEWEEIGIQFEWLRLLGLGVLYGALGIAIGKGGWLPAIAGVLRRTPALALLLLLPIASTAWSVDPFHTLTRSIVLVSTAIIGIYIGLRYRLDDILTILLATTAVLAAVTVIGAALSIDLSKEPSVVGLAWRGPFEHKNHLGRAMLVGCTALALKWTDPAPSPAMRIWQIALGVLLGTALVLSMSTTSQLLTGMTLALSFYLPYLLRPTTRREYAVAIAGGIVGAGLGAVALWYSADTLSLLGKDRTLTGRSDVWSLLIPYVSDRPWSGYGYHAFWGHFRGSIEQSMQWTSVVEAYNGYIELLLDCGIPGLLLVLAALGAAAHRSIRYYRRNPQRQTLFPILALFCLAALNVTGSHLVRYDGFWWMLFCLILALTIDEGSQYGVDLAHG
jgi:exopolysaccharide production protein ExoQ